MQRLIEIKVKTRNELYDLIRQECINKGYSHKTIKCYQSWAKKFLFYSNNHLQERFIEPFITYLSNKEEVKSTTRNNAIWALKFIFEKCLKKKLGFIPETAKIPLSMPEIIAKDKILFMINSIQRSKREYTLKHRLVIELLYSSGLRLSELINLKVGRIDFVHKRIFVKEGKGFKDRITLLSEVAEKDIKEYLKVRRYKQNPYLFDKEKNYHISGRTVGKILERQAKECQIQQRVYPHILRDSFATHLLEQGVDSRYIQRLLGHARLETTTKYTRVADVNLMAIKSPLDVV